MRLDNIHRSTLHKTLGLPDKIDAELEARCLNVACYRYPPEWWEQDNSPTRDLLRMPPLIGHFTIIIKKGFKDSKHKSSQHRVFVACKCGREVPAGRMGQHRCKHWPTPQIVAQQEEIDRNRKEFYSKTARDTRQTVTQ